MSTGDPVVYEGSKGRICCINTFAETACVQFSFGCVVVDLHALQPAAEPAPVCTAQCTDGC